MSRPFNFYEQAPTGLISGLGINGTVYVNGSGAFVGPFAQNFTGSGIYLSSAFTLGGAAGFAIPIPEDADYWPTSFSISMVGSQVKGNKNIASLGTRYSGSVFPLFRDTGYYGIRISGSLSGSNKDILNNQVSLSGYITSGNRDIPIMSVHVSGYITSGQRELINNQCSLSGFFTTGNRETCSLSSSFQGFFIRANKDYLNVNLTLSNVSYTTGLFIGHYVESAQDTANVNLIFSSVIYSKT